ncbi:hypothetical protein [Mesorhizobium sp. B2-8-3]|uniref:hypothetical protein n=1 Tax=Mesorhizobium sp. B2-8-3 TaxID=2589905 RepID=UPI00112E0FFF|nr:hypothetical protein [Mesorhizobium sp. B2-8-3]TPJ26873.1 hypothetical protein FJ418_29255 [Mesorhizobium sp. B2-8-3]
MNKSNVSFRNRLLIWRYEYSDAILGVAFFCALALTVGASVLRLQNDPVVATQRVTGVVEHVSLAPINPKAAVGRGIYYIYDVRLQDDNALVLVDGDVGTPHSIGSIIPIERQHHKRGVDTYRLFNG